MRSRFDLVVGHDRPSSRPASYASRSIASARLMPSMRASQDSRFSANASRSSSIKSELLVKKAKKFRCEKACEAADFVDRLVDPEMGRSDDRHRPHKLSALL